MRQAELCTAAFLCLEAKGFLDGGRAPLDSHLSCEGCSECSWDLWSLFMSQRTTLIKNALAHRDRMKCGCHTLLCPKPHTSVTLQLTDLQRTCFVC